MDKESDKLKSKKKKNQFLGETNIKKLSHEHEKINI